MRQSYDISRGWLMTVKAKDKTEYAPAEVNLPFIHAADDFDLIIIEKEVEIGGEEGSDAYLEVYGTTGNVRITADCKALADRPVMQTMFRTHIASDVTEEVRKVKLRLEITPRPRTDGRMIIGRIRLLYVGGYHFTMSDSGDLGVSAKSVITEEGGTVTVKYEVNDPTNYDIVNAVLRDANDGVVAVKSARATDGTLSIDVGHDSVWCRPRYTKRTLDISLLRDTALLDSFLLPLAVYDDKIEGGKLSRNNGKPEKLLGVYMHDLSCVRRDLALLRDAGVKAVRLSSLTAKTCFFDMLDDMGLVGWYDLPFTGKEEDFINLLEMLSQFSCHPSFRFICCDSRADEKYVSRFTETVNAADCGIIPVLHYDLKQGGTLPETLPAVIDVEISTDRSGNVDFDFTSAFDKLRTDAPDCSFSVSVHAPADLSGGETALSGVHKRIFTLLSVRTDMLCWFAGHIRNTATEYGLYSGSSLNLAGEMYRAAYSEQEFLRIEGSGSYTSPTRETEITVFSNNPSFKILVNSKPPKTPVIKKICDGIYTIGGLRLGTRPTLVEISAGETCDNITVYRGR